MKEATDQAIEKIAREAVRQVLRDRFPGFLTDSREPADFQEELEVWIAELSDSFYEDFPTSWSNEEIDAEFRRRKQDASTRAVDLLAARMNELKTQYEASIKALRKQI